MGVSLQRPKLRAKTGCLPCRQQRIKCDEKTPICRACCASRVPRNCEWPSDKDLVDRRFRSFKLKLRESSKAVKRHYESDPSSSVLRLAMQLPRADFVMARERERCDLEWALFREFGRQGPLLLLLPHCSSVFSKAWHHAIRRIMVSRKSLSPALMACAMSLVSARGGLPGMCHVSHQYYINSLARLACSLSQGFPEKDDDILITIVLLYAFNFISGSSSCEDQPQHVSAAIKIIISRIQNATSAECSSAFFRLTLESILFQVFMLNNGLWSGATSYVSLQPLSSELWARCEELLEQPANVDFAQVSLNSPVLGVPWALMRLAMFFGQLCFGREVASMEDLLKLQTEVKAWEDYALQAAEQTDASDALNRDANCLYAMIASILMQHLIAVGPNTGLPRVSPTDSWQAYMALQILSRRAGDHRWSECYIGTWPVYALGFLLSEREDRDIVMHDIRSRWELTGFWIVKRSQQDLERSWAELETSTSVNYNVSDTPISTSLRSPALNVVL
ncbi:putative transcriptional regulatory protein [Fusarium oxysporum f. sp. cubense]|uniref:Putative transcriptional regulatory protein n=1 Tax=Fusarium oxysporum f. sp. cubense TaxID=61366 RepID=A0A559LL49_FUSOC|nr:putative transcriptional regulatory protein [Fusarium oxysporum f. sp. cubense]